MAAAEQKMANFLPIEFGAPPTLAFFGSGAAAGRPQGMFRCLAGEKHLMQIMTLLGSQIAAF